MRLSFLDAESHMIFDYFDHINHVVKFVFALEHFSGVASSKHLQHLVVSLELVLRDDFSLKESIVEGSVFAIHPVSEIQLPFLLVGHQVLVENKGLLLLVLNNETLVLGNAEQGFEGVLRSASSVICLLVSTFDFEQVFSLEWIHGAIELEDVKIQKDLALVELLLLDLRRNLALFWFLQILAELNPLVEAFLFLK